MILDGKKIPYEKIDITASEDAKLEMRKLAGCDTALAPQLCNGDQYCGVSHSRRSADTLSCALQGYDEFEDAVESDSLDSFLKLGCDED